MDDDDNPIQVVEETEVQDMTNVPDTDQSLFPVSADVRVHIKRAGSQESNDGMIKVLLLGLQAMEGVPGIHPETGEEIMKYQGAYINHGFITFTYWVDPERPNPKGTDWVSAGKAFIGFKQLLKALDKPLVGVRVNDEFMRSLIGNDLIVDVNQEKNKDTGVVSNKIRNIKKAE